MAKQKKDNSSANSYGNPNFPYTLSPSALGRFLEIVPTKPKPTKINAPILKAWGFKNTNDQTIIRVLKTLELLTQSNEPTPIYEDFMQKAKGPAVLGRQIKKVYEQLFSTVSNPGNAPQEELQSFFNTYGGGSERAIQLQIQTFKAMASHATFGADDPLEQSEDITISQVQNSHIHSSQGSAAIRIDLHIHLPENKTKAEYDSILESIAKHIYGNNI